MRFASQMEALQHILAGEACFTVTIMNRDDNVAEFDRAELVCLGGESPVHGQVFPDSTLFEVAAGGEAHLGYILMFFTDAGKPVAVFGFRDA